MKKILFLCCAILAVCIAHAQLNVSTGINGSGSIALGTQDANWAISSIPYTGQAYAGWVGTNHTINYISGAWEPTPIISTGAQWIGPSQDLFVNTSGIFTFERPFHIGPGIGSFTCNFSVAVDDSLVSLELVRPNSTTIALPVTLVSNQYHLSQPITTLINCPDTGYWKIRAVVDYTDVLDNGFLLSGYINTSKKATCDSTCKLTLYGVTNGGPFSCGSTIKIKCNSNYDFGPRLDCSGSGCSTTITSVTLTDPSNTTPSWANAFISNLGNGSLFVPGGIPQGIYTLTYNYGVNGQICGSCKFKLNIICTPCNCTLNNTVVVGGGKKLHVKCGGTLTLNCGTTNGFTPSLSCNGDPNIHMLDLKLFDAGGNTPSWANADFFTNLGNGNLIIPPGISGIFTLRYIWGKGCSPCDSCSYTLKIQCCESFSVNAGPDVVLCGPAQLNATVTGGLAPFTYSWTPTTGLSNPNIANPILSTAGTYVVSVTDAAGCVKTDTLKAVGGGNGCLQIKQDVQQNDNSRAVSNKLQVVPNPFANSFTIQGLDNNVSSLDILTADGKQVSHYNNITSNESFGKGLSAGAYLIKVFYKDGSFKTLKIIKD